MNTSLYKFSENVWEKHPDVVERLSDLLEKVKGDDE